MKHRNIQFLLQMTKEFLIGEVDFLTYSLDFPHEVEIRYKRLVSENKVMAELIYDCLVEDGADLHYQLSEEEFRTKIDEQYEFVSGVYEGRIDFI